MAETIVPQNISDSNDTNRQGELSLWAVWWNAIILLRPAFPQLRIFLWFAVSAAGTSIHIDTLGAVSCIIRALNLKPCFYHALLRNFRGKAVRLDELSALWTQIVLLLFPAPLRVNGRLLIVGDGIKIAKWN